MMKSVSATARSVVLALVLVVFSIQAILLVSGRASAAGADVAQFTLENGLEVIVIPDRRTPVVSHMIWYKVGSADEPAGKSGIAHFLEHLLFKGTKTYPAGEFSRKVAEIGGEENAFTTVDQTGYYQKVTPDALEMVMRYEADRMRNLVIDRDDLETERQVVLEERNQRVGANPGAMLSEAMTAALYQNHPYGIPIIGWQHEIEALTLEDTLEFYERFYHPANAVVIVAGDIDPARVHELAMATYGNIETTRKQQSRSRPAEPEPVAARRVELRDPRVTAPGFRRNYLVPSYRLAESGEAEAIDLLASILGGTSTSRIRRSMTVDDPIASGAGAFYWGGYYDMAELTVYATPLPEIDMAEAEKRIDAIISDLVENGIDQEELDTARNGFIKATIFERDSQMSLARTYGTVLTTGGTVEDVAEWPDRLRAVTVDDINRVARKYLDPKRSVSGFLLAPEPGQQ